jgi:chromosome segregation ATPase
MAADPLGDKKLKDLLLDWQGKIKDHRESFIRSADKISQWDAGLRSATVELRQLELEVESLEQESKSVQASLQSMESSQNSLESRLRVEEEKFRQRVDLNPDSGAYVARAQMARRDAYNAAMELQALLDGLEQALNKVDEMVTTAAEASLNNPVRPFLATGCPPFFFPLALTALAYLCWPLQLTS